MCKIICATSSRPTYSYFLSFPHSLSTTLSPSYGLSLAMFILLLSVLYQHKCFNAPLQCSPYHIDILPLLYDQLLHFPSLSCLCSTYNIVCIYMHIYTSYILNTSYYIVQIRRGNLLLYARGPSISLLIELIDEKDQG